MFTHDLVSEAEALLQHCRSRSVRVATAESCTGGLIAALLTEVAGSSDVVECGFVTYSNAAKTRMLGVPEALIEAHGAVSAPVAMAMAQGALAHSDADVSVSVTGIAGPSGGTAEKPVGLVHFATLLRGGEVQHFKSVFAGTRHEVREQAVRQALALLRDRLR